MGGCFGGNISYILLGYLLSEAEPLVREAEPPVREAEPPVREAEPLGSRSQAEPGNELGRLCLCCVTRQGINSLADSGSPLKRT